ncbi:hypothetical protein FHS27_001456 [Rhodopirellula rubra]|uniref:Uncharacterized protein n=1 Tax=Aporhodopirellula rubra TaxID=980271 RepID=A0A7W5DXZ5_9BACT|nr:hypothetical protein [Aporhodopirellula rubra]
MRRRGQKLLFGRLDRPFAIFLRLMDQKLPGIDNRLPLSD